MGGLRLWGPVGAWMGVLFYASAQSDTGPFGRVPDWVTHGAAYFVLGALLGRAVAGGFGRRLSLAGALVVVGVGTAYGLSDEWHQSFTPGRDASPWDVAKDFAGVSAAALAQAAGLLPARSEA